MKVFRYIFLLLSFIAIKACDNTDTQFNTKAIKSEIDGRKIRRISEATILEEAFSRGKKVIAAIDKQQSKKTTDTAQGNSRLGSLEAYVEDLQQQNKAEIKKIFVSDLNGPLINKDEKAILEAYQYNMSEGLQLNDNAQIMQNYIFYTSPIVEKGELKGMWSIFFEKEDLIAKIN